MKYLTKTQIPHCLNWILGLISCLAFHSHHQWKNSENWTREENNRVKEMKKCEEQLREKERENNWVRKNATPKRLWAESLFYHVFIWWKAKHNISFRLNRGLLGYDCHAPWLGLRFTRRRWLFVKTRGHCMGEWHSRNGKLVWAQSREV